MLSFIYSWNYLYFDCRGTTSRPIWFVAHWLFGITAVVLGWFNIFKGLDEYIQAWAGGERKVSHKSISITAECREVDLSWEIPDGGRDVICVVITTYNVWSFSLSQWLVRSSSPKNGSLSTWVLILSFWNSQPSEFMDHNSIGLGMQSKTLHSDCH